MATKEAQYVTAFREFERDGAAADPSWVRDIRRSAIADFERLGFPVERKGNEPWKYTDVRPLASAEFATSGPGNRLTAQDIGRFDLPCPRVHQLVFVNGHYAPALSTEPPSEAELHSDVLVKRSDGPIVGRLADALAYGLPLVHQHLARHVLHDRNSFAALNTAFVHDGAFVYIPNGMTVLEPIHLLFITTDTGPPAVTHPRVLVIAGRDSKATVVHSFEGLAASGGYFTNSVTEVVAGADAVLNMCRIQREGDASFHMATTHASLGRDSTLASTALDLGGGLVRHDISAELTGAGAHVSLNGLYLGTGERHIDNHTFIDHAVPDTISDEVYKGILDDQAHGVFVGHILVRPDAQRSDARLFNKSLLLSKGAEMDTQPKLEIFADDVKCTHGAAVGQIDKDALFYLNSRGLGSDEAHRLLVHGFVNEVVESIDDDAVRQYADQAVMAALGETESGVT